jgi:hypothetical protein
MSTKPLLMHGTSLRLQRSSALCTHEKRCSRFSLFPTSLHSYISLGSFLLLIIHFFLLALHLLFSIKQLLKMRPTALHAVFLPHLSTAQSSAQGTQNPFTVPACATMLSIALSCESKFTDASPVTASIYNCLCFDNSGNYVPSVYDNAVAGCASELADQTTDLNFWLPGFCTDTEYATETAAGMSTTGGGLSTLTGLTGIPTVTSTGGVIDECLL